jgi:hypothetical protein
MASNTELRLTARTWKDIDLEYRLAMTKMRYSKANKAQMLSTPIDAQTYYEDIALLLKTIHAMKEIALEDRVVEYINKLKATNPEYFDNDLPDEDECYIKPNKPKV